MAQARRPFFIPARSFTRKPTQTTREQTRGWKHPEVFVARRLLKYLQLFANTKRVYVTTTRLLGFCNKFNIIDVLIMN